PAAVGLLIGKEDFRAPCVPVLLADGFQIEGDRDALQRPQKVIAPAANLWDCSPWSPTPAVFSLHGSTDGHTQREETLAYLGILVDVARGFGTRIALAGDLCYLAVGDRKTEQAGAGHACCRTAHRP